MIAAPLSLDELGRQMLIAAAYARTYEARRHQRVRSGFLEGFRRDLRAVATPENVNVLIDSGILSCMRGVAKTLWTDASCDMVDGLIEEIKAYTITADGDDVPESDASELLRELVGRAEAAGVDPAFLGTASDGIAEQLLELEARRRLSNPRRKARTDDLSLKVAAEDARLRAAGTESRIAVLRTRFGMSRPTVYRHLARAAELSHESDRPETLPR